MASTYTEGKHKAEFLVSEANGSLSREVVNVASGQTLVAGAVLGKVTATSEYKAYDNSVTTGEAVAAAVVLDNVDASAATTPAVVIIRQAEVNKAELTYKTTQSAADQTAALTDLASLGVVGR